LEKTIRDLLHSMGGIAILTNLFKEKKDELERDVLKALKQAIINHGIADLPSEIHYSHIATTIDANKEDFLEIGGLKHVEKLLRNKKGTIEKLVNANILYKYQIRKQCVCLLSNLFTSGLKKNPKNPD
jgi:hypothetical protein